MTFRIRNFEPDDADWLIQHHQEHYSKAEGFDDTFGPLVGSSISDFVQNHDPAVEAGWIAQDENGRLGSIFCVRLNDARAKLRLFYVAETARGTGVAQALLDTCLTFARQKGYAEMTLWTHRSHVAAGAVYRRNGFDLMCEKQVHSFGVDLVEQTWEIRF